MNLTLMCQYIEFCADRLMIALQQTNFIKKCISKYAKSGVGMKETTLEHHTLHFDDDDINF